MSKYNHIHSIPIESVPKEEIAIAINEWAEGDEAMERLLWACYENGVKTDGCHTGMCPYLGLKYTGSNDKVIKLLAACINLEESQIFISPDGGNPISGEDWYITNIGIGFETESIEKSGKNLDTLSSALNNDTSLKEAELISLLLKLSDFLVDKESALKLRFNYSENKYSFSIECTPVNEEVSIYFDKLFKEANFFEAENPVKESKRRFWKIESDNLDDMIICDTSFSSPSEGMYFISFYFIYPIFCIRSFYLKERRMVKRSARQMPSRRSAPFSSRFPAISRPAKKVRTV